MGSTEFIATSAAGSLREIVCASTWACADVARGEDDCPSEADSVEKRSDWVT